MSEEINVYKGKVKKKGNFEFKDVYSFLYDYLIDEGYDVYEDDYLEKRQGDSKEVELNWTAKKSVSGYFQFKIKTYWLILGLKNVEIEDPSTPGKKLKTENGTVEINIKSLLIKDYQNAWKGNFWKYMRKIYDKYMIRKRIEQEEDNLIEDTNKYIAFIRSLLEMKGQHALRKETLL